MSNSKLQYFKRKDAVIIYKYLADRFDFYRNKDTTLPQNQREFIADIMSVLMSDIKRHTIKD